MKRFLAIMMLLCGQQHASFADTDTLYQSIRNPWSSYVFVSTLMPESTLIALARQASVIHAVMVINGFPSGDHGWQKSQMFVREINDACCGSRPPSWQIYPQLFQQYHISSVPAIVIAKTGGTRAQDFARVTGDIGFGEALKLFAQKSSYPDIRDRATYLYQIFAKSGY